jgi:hypothetical protein
MALGPEQRGDVALHALAGTTPISRLAAEHEVSRKFVYRQCARVPGIAQYPCCFNHGMSCSIHLPQGEGLWNALCPPPWTRQYSNGI